MNIEAIRYQGSANCYRLSNGVIELIIAADFGTRILHFGFVGEKNVFYVNDPLEAARGKWDIYGGHRLWHAPEVDGRTNLPDNAPITIEDHGEFVRVIQPVEAGTQIVKEMDIFLHPDVPRVEIVHRLRNQGMWDATLALWALSVMRTGGMAIIPLPPRGTHPEDLLPASTLILWKYTDLSDARFRFGKRHLFIHQDVNASTPQKIGASVPNGWAAYVNDQQVFVKQFKYTEHVPYADMGSSLEIFTNSWMLESETLSPIVTIPPGKYAEHHERWTLARVEGAIVSDDDVDRVIRPLL